MLERNVTVAYLAVKNSFIYFPKNLEKFSHGTCVKLIFGNEKVGYFSVGDSMASLNDNSIGISSFYCKVLGIKENELVLLSEIPTMPTINSITITPASGNDYDVIESLAESIQSTLLNQIRVVYSGQKCVIWIGNNINVSVFVDDVKPVSPGFLGFLTEVHIKPNLEYNEKPHSVPISNIEKMTKGFQSFFEKINVFQEKKEIKVENNLERFLNYKHDLVYRLVAIEYLPSNIKVEEYIKPFSAFISKKNVSFLNENSESTAIYGSISLITGDVLSNKPVYVRLYALEDFCTEVGSKYRNCIFVNNIIFDHFNCDSGIKVILKHINEPPSVREIDIHTKKKFVRNVKEEFRKYLSHSKQQFVLNSNFPMVIGSNILCSLKFSPPDSKFIVVDNDSLENLKYNVVEEELIQTGKKTSTSEDMLNTNKFLESISNYKDIIDTVLQNFQNDSNQFENILITGKPGTGKTMILQNIAQKLRIYPNFIYTNTLNCRQFRGKTPDSLMRVLSEIFSTLILYQPSVLILDNLHILCENIQGDETAPNSLYHNRISEMLHSFFELFSGSNRIGICASTESVEKLNKHLYSSRGSHLFKDLYTIQDFSKSDRMDLLKYLFGNNGVDEVNFEELAVKTEGFVAHDISDFYNKTLFEIHKEADEEHCLRVNQKHCEDALKNTCVLSLQNVSLHSPGGKDFSDVGGLKDIKEILFENLMWPAKYPNIFSNAPLRLQSGLLLYGPPGTGKTLLAAAAAKHCGLRLISVKGPELLSKYIGASEQAVRDIFQKAQSVKPCILFFDEFDSLAPRRGHDNTGVTDRVVNQLLTQLDGVESLTGVCVLAATSRPDLLDPALLRPGRLDRQLVCPLPDKEGRLSILTVLSKNLDLAGDMDLEKIAEATEWFSGADLQSLLYTAQMSTIGGILDTEQISDELSTMKITQKHLEEALAKTKPSLTRQERLKYERIYASFKSGSKLDNFQPGSRATLA